ncbi:hypothetical protein R1sor_005998 [Riccia sorocarpa]|uniref:Uncharacterized protein n=1 Tax=Riccia sorocarpa TaxID=122646 RepID=A0ABD3HP38_9MARC
MNEILMDEKASKNPKTSRVPSLVSRCPGDGCTICRKEFEEKLRLWRRVVWGVYCSTLLLAFVVGFYFTFMSTANMSVQRVYLHQGGQRDYAIKRLYSEQASYGINVDMEKKKNEAMLEGIYNQFGLRIITNDSTSSDDSEWRESLTCPCTRKSVSWTDYTHFYFLTYSHPDGKPYIRYQFQPELDGKLEGIIIDDEGAFDPQYLIRTPSILHTYRDFCNLLNNVPADLLIVQSQYMVCQDLVSPLLSSSIPDGEQSRWRDSRSSFFESPLLLQQDLFYSRSLHLMRRYLREKQTLMQTSSTIADGNSTNRDMFLTALTDIWMYALDTYARNSSSSDADFFIAGVSHTFQDFAEQLSYYPYHFGVMVDEGQTFLGLSMNWTEYYHVCKPSYCDVIENRGQAHRACIALALLGGFGTFILPLAYLAIWPVLDGTLVYFCRRRTAKCSNDPSVNNPSSNPSAGNAILLRTSTSRVLRPEHGIDIP